ncbi:hypothetical protein [Ruegeria arenilitoris]|uniref:hypothetical protein n=1 Tax=Ruegeria arenilitoris TaxID=1173585 RepID=UPI00147AB334|nr:hypothetical protein [Ruegeria arenilitoris]
MKEITLTPTNFENAIWEGHILSDAEPSIEAIYLDELLEGIELIPANGGWNLRIPVPIAALSDGVHCIAIYDADSDRKLSDFTIIAGTPAADDLRAEVALLRSELDMLKRAFRRSMAPKP